MRWGNPYILTGFFVLSLSRAHLHARAHSLQTDCVSPNMHLDLPFSFPFFRSLSPSFLFFCSRPFQVIWEEMQGAVHAVDSMTCKTPAEAGL